MEWIMAHKDWLLVVLYLVVNEIVLHNPKFVSGSIVNLLWNTLKSAVVGKPTPPLPPPGA